MITHESASVLSIGVPPTLHQSSPHWPDHFAWKELWPMSSEVKSILAPMLLIWLVYTQLPALQIIGQPLPRCCQACLSNYEGWRSQAIKLNEITVGTRVLVTMSYNYNLENCKGGLWYPMPICKDVSQKSSVFPAVWAEYCPWLALGVLASCSSQVKGIWALFRTLGSS
jgi:hypothetical protein